MDKALRYERATFHWPIADWPLDLMLERAFDDAKVSEAASGEDDGEVSVGGASGAPMTRRGRYRRRPTPLSRSIRTRPVNR